MYIFTFFTVPRLKRGNQHIDTFWV